jgi:alpha-beta hydrolase superfamily lysophospholipase
VKGILNKLLIGLGIFLAIILGIVLFVGLFPVSYRGLESQPNPATSYEDAVARYQAIEQAEKGLVHESGKSFLLTHGQNTPRVYVLIHGVTNSPTQWLEFGQMMYDRGHNVLIVRMPYHGLKSNSVSELRKLTPQDLRAYGDQVIDIAAGLGDEVYVAGISGGGAVTAWAVQNRLEVDRAFMVSPFFGVGEVPDALSNVLMNAFSHLPNFDISSAEEVIREYAYPGQATRAVADFLVLGHSVRVDAKRGAAPHVPVFVQTTVLDLAANNKSTEILVDLWKKEGADVTTYQFNAFQGVPHNSVDPAEKPEIRQLVYENMLEFFGEEKTAP